jgi:hypothetical protein
LTSNLFYEFLALLVNANLNGDWKHQPYISISKDGEMDGWMDEI